MEIPAAISRRLKVAKRDYRAQPLAAGGPIVAFTIPLKQVVINGGQTYRRSARGGLYKTEEASKYEDAIRGFARRAMQGREPFVCRVAVELRLFFANPRSDIDGPVKLTLDGLKGAVFADDCQVYELRCFKEIDERPRTEVRVWPLPI